MNIFVLDEDVKLAAQYHNNKHVVKMVLETAQLLCGVHHVIENELDVPYRLSHKNHPCSIWARECIENYIWLCDFGIELAKEYTHRYDKRHKCQDIIEWCIENKPNLLENGDLTPFALAMPEDYKTDDPVESYRRYYILDKPHIADWKKRDKPEWFTI
tara:strand:+ start:3593 stop:4066 length:474 start_codon:yes stop_codon:yes gene_type:complete